MERIRLLKEPGYVYDLMYVFCLKFNHKIYAEEYRDEDTRAENEAYFAEIMKQFGEISDDLYVFFHAIDTARAFITTFYFKPYKDRFASGYDFGQLQTELSDHRRLIRNLIKFYFHELDDETVETCADSPARMFPVIKGSSYSDAEKTKLYEFFADPSPYIRLLQYELMQKEVMLSEYYKNNYQLIIELYDRTTVDTVCKQMEGLSDFSFLESEGVLYVSYCLLNRLLINRFPVSDGVVAVLGREYADVLDSIKNRNEKADLCGLGSALGENSRMQILRLLSERREATCREIERAFNFSGSTAYHHITLLIRVGALKSRNVGKTIYYRLNRKYFDSMIDQLKMFSSK